MKKILVRILTVILYGVGVQPSAASVPQLSIKERNGKFTHIELIHGTEINHINSTGDSGLDLQLLLPSGRKIEIPVMSLDSYEIVNTDIPALSFHFPDHSDAEQIFLKEDYIKATLDIHGNGVVNDMSELELTMKGRGNSSWQMSKKPMRMKFSKKTSICEFKKAKNYVLLANFIDHTHVHNTLALWLGNKLGMKYTNHYQPCDVFINDRYIGLFLLTEKVGINSGSVDINENEGILFELSKEFDEDYKFRSPKFNLPVMVKDPDFEELYEDNPEGITPEQRFKIWQEDFNYAEQLAWSGKGAEAFDLDDMVNYMLVYDIMRNGELYHPKSCYLYKLKQGKDEKYHFGPIWDFDYSMNAPTIDRGNVVYMSPKGQMSNHKFFSCITNLEEYKQKYKERFTFFYDNIFPEMLEFIDEYGAIIEISSELDGKKWNRTINYGWSAHIPSISHADNMKDLKAWLKERVEFLKQQL